MKETKLISMTAFIQWLEDNMDLKKSTNALWLQSKDFMRLAKSYKNFLSQPLELGHFVPCVDGVLIEDPQEENYIFGVGEKPSKMIIDSQYESDLEQYKQAKERVLFEGFECEKIKLVERKETYYIVKEKGTEYGCVWLSLNNSQTIENTMLQHNTTLTQAALTKIGL